jgi:hypothetical protein
MIKLNFAQNSVVKIENGDLIFDLEKNKRVEIEKDD